MSKKTDKLIDALCSEECKVKPLPCPLTRAAILSAFAFIYFVFITVMFFSPWDDLLAKANMRFTIEQSCALLLGFSAAFGSLYLSVPGKKHGKWMKIIPLTLLGAVFVLLITSPYWAGFTGLINIEDQKEHMHCMGIVSLYAIPPAVILLLMLKKAAPTNPLWVGSLALLSAGGFGYFGVRMVCDYTEIVHQTGTHFIPVLIYLALGFGIGRLYLKW